jgi:hypothetical protein
MNLIFKLTLVIVLFSSCASTTRTTVTSFVEATPVYQYTNAENLDIFEVTTYGTNSIQQLGDNAKAQLLKLLLKNGYNGIKDFKPLVPNPIMQEKLLNEKYDVLSEILNDKTCMTVDYKQMIKPIFISKRKIYTKTFMVTINLNNIKNKLNSLL